MISKRIILLTLFISFSFLFLVSYVSALEDSELEFCKIYGIDADGNGGWGTDDKLKIANECYGRLIEEGKDEGICELSSIENYLLEQRNCGDITQLDCNQRYRTPEITSCCAVMGLGQGMVPEQGDCYYGFAIAKDDPRLCEKAAESQNRFNLNSCYYDLAVNSDSLGDWVDYVGKTRVYTVSIFMVLSLLFFVGMQFSGPKFRRGSIVPGAIIFLFAIFMTFMSLDSGGAADFIALFGGFIPGLITLNFILNPLFVLGWTSIMKKVQRKRTWSLVYGIVGGAILSVIIFTSIIFLFIPGDTLTSGEYMLGIAIFGQFFMAIYAVLFGIAFLVSARFSPSKDKSVPKFKKELFTHKTFA